MLVYRRQLEEAANSIDGKISDSRFVEDFQNWIDSASGADLYAFVNAILRSLELEGKGQ